MLKTLVTDHPLLFYHLVAYDSLWRPALAVTTPEFLNCIALIVGRVVGVPLPFPSTPNGETKYFPLPSINTSSHRCRALHRQQTVIILRSTAQLPVLGEWLHCFYTLNQVEQILSVHHRRNAQCRIILHCKGQQATNIQNTTLRKFSMVLFQRNLLKTLVQSQITCHDVCKARTLARSFCQFNLIFLTIVAKIYRRLSFSS